MIARRDLLIQLAPPMLLALSGARAGAEDKVNIRLVLDWKYEGEHAQFTVPATDGTFDRRRLRRAPMTWGSPTPM